MKNKKVYKEVMCIYASFAYLANVIERNDISEPLKEAYRRTAHITAMYRRNMEKIIHDVNTAVGAHESIIVDELLVSIAILANYKEKFQNRVFNPIDWDKINDVMNGLIDDIIAKNGDWNKVNRSIDYAEYVVDHIAKFGDKHE